MKTLNGSRSVAAVGMYALRQHRVYQISCENYVSSVAKILQKVIVIFGPRARGAQQFSLAADQHNFLESGSNQMSNSALKEKPRPHIVRSFNILCISLTCSRASSRCLAT